MLIEELEKALKEGSGYGICHFVKVHGGTDKTAALVQMLNIVRELGYYSGNSTFPIADKGGSKSLDAVSVYCKYNASGELYSTQTTYGRRRRKVVRELIKWLKDMKKKQL